MEVGILNEKHISTSQTEMYQLESNKESSDYNHIQGS